MQANKSKPSCSFEQGGFFVGAFLLRLFVSSGLEVGTEISWKRTPVIGDGIIVRVVAKPPGRGRGVGTAYCRVRDLF